MGKETELYTVNLLLKSMEEYFQGIEAPAFVTAYWTDEKADLKERDILVTGTDIYGNPMEDKRFDLDKMLWYMKIKARVEIRC